VKKLPQVFSIKRLEKDEKETRNSWAENAGLIINELEQGKDVAFFNSGGLNDLSQLWLHPKAY
jgi:precorrin-2 methylase